MSNVPTICSICEHPMQPLPERTAQTHEPIYVCVTGKGGKKKVPCDGGLYENATRYSGA